MSRQYGLPAGHWEEDTTGHIANFSPRAHYDVSQPRQFPQYPAPSQQSAMRSPPRKPVASYATASNTSPQRNAQAAPPYQSQPPSPPRHYYQPSTSMNRSSPVNAAVGGAVPGATGATTYGQPFGHDSQALRDIDSLYGGRIASPSPQPSARATPRPYTQSRPMHRPADSQSSVAPLRSYAVGMPQNSTSPPRIDRSGMPAPDMAGYGYGYGYDQNMPQGNTATMGAYTDYVDPHDIADDGDDGFEETPVPRRHVFGGPGTTGASSAAGAGILGAFGARNANGNYGQIPGGARPSGGSDPEKSEWLKSQTGGKNYSKYLLGGLGILLVCGIIAGVVGGVIASNPGTDKTGPAPSSPSGVYTLNSPEVQAVLNNKDLHKVFPGMDYTPLNAQYPACLETPPNQDNITLDVAVLSQLAPAIRLYGTDCDQTQMVLTAISRLEMNETMKVWLGVWLENNSTTNERQLNQMYQILKTYPADHFAGVIVGNEVLFRKDMTAAQLGSELQTVRKNLASMGVHLPVSTSDIGSAWTAAIAADSDILMANVHPFFAGIKPNAATAWTNNFWTGTDVPLAGPAYGSYPQSIISETGWPSEGGNDCGTGAKCPTKTDGAIAGIDEMNTFMDGWVCSSLAKGTTYFWFEAFDQPWTVIFDDPKTGDYWEPHWGLMDVNRNVKKGLKIPDCGGKTVDKPY